MIAAAVKILQLSSVASAANPDHSLPCDSSDVAASSSAAQDITVNAAPPAPAYCQPQGTEHGTDSYVDLTLINHSFDEMLNACDKWHGNVRQKMSAALRDSMEEFSRLTSSGSREEGVKSIREALRGKFSQIFTCGEAIELLQTFVAGCMGVLRACSDDCDKILNECGANKWSKHYKQKAWVQYHRLNNNCFKGEWYRSFHLNALNFFGTLEMEIEDLAELTGPSSLGKQGITSKDKTAMKERVRTWFSIFTDFEFSLKNAHSVISKIYTSNNDAFLNESIELITSHSTGAKSAESPSQRSLEDDVDESLAKLYTDMKYYLSTSKKMIASVKITASLSRK
ncbi:hypothetical protein PAPHI01_1388 [Pancytospora philotis]|nr:hypothetical protein PAPHI01_1388 [Pancytospora philotis]